MAQVAPPFGAPRIRVTFGFSEGLKRRARRQVSRCRGHDQSWDSYPNADSVLVEDPPAVVVTDPKSGRFGTFGQCRATVLQGDLARATSLEGQAMRASRQPSGVEIMRDRQGQA
jgi:hypothetical protein